MAIPYYKNIDIPYKLNEYINENEYVTLPINFDIKEDNYIRKNVYERDILNTNFSSDLDNVDNFKELSELTLLIESLDLRNE